MYGTLARDGLGRPSFRVQSAAKLSGCVLQIIGQAGGVRLHQQRGGVLPDRFRLALLWKPLRHQAGRLRHRFDDVPVA